MIELNKYQELKPHRLKRIFWCACNAFLFPVLSRRMRRALVRLFGGRIGNSLIYRSVRIYAPWNLEMGDWCCIGPRVEIYNKGPVRIGHHVAISQDAYVCTASHDVDSPTMALVTKPVVIGDGSWIAARAVILPGVTLGRGAVVGCAAVVPRDVPDRCVVGGNPARVLKERAVG